MGDVLNLKVHRCVMRVCFAGFLVLAFSIGRCGIAEDAPKAHPAIPSTELIRSAEMQVKTSFAKEYADAATPMRKGALSATLLKYGQETQGDPNVRYVLLRDARDFAAEAGAFETAVAAVDALGNLFDVDVFKEKTTVLDRALKASKATAVSQAIAGEALKVLDQAIEADRLDAAAESATLATSAAQKAKDTGLVKYLGSIRKDVASRHKEQEAFREAGAALVNAPDDSEANRVRGLYLCLRRNDWKAGIAHLAKAKDPALQQIADLEAGAPTLPDQQVQLADAWWKYGEKPRELSRDVFRHRALYWYRSALPQAAAQRATIEKRLKDEAKAVKPQWVFVKIASFGQGLLDHPETPNELTGRYENGVANVFGKKVSDTKTIAGELRGWFGKAVVWKIPRPEMINGRVDVLYSVASQNNNVLLLDQDLKPLANVYFQAVGKNGSVAITLSHDPLDQSISLSVQNTTSKMLQTAKATVMPDKPVYVAVCIVVRSPGDEANATVRATAGR